MSEKNNRVKILTPIVVREIVEQMPFKKSLTVSTVLHIAMLLIINLFAIIADHPLKPKDIEFKLVNTSSKRSAAKPAVQTQESQQSNPQPTSVQPQEVTPQSKSTPKSAAKPVANPTSQFQVAVEPDTDAAIPSSKVRRSSSTPSQPSSSATQGSFNNTASSDTTTSSSTSQGQGMGGVTSFDISPYISELRRNIKLNWKVPSNSDGKHVELFLRIGRDGRIVILNVKTTSEIGDLDESTLEAVRRSTPLGPLPAGFTKNYLDIVFKFNSANASVR